MGWTATASGVLTLWGSCMARAAGVPDGDGAAVFGEERAELVPGSYSYGSIAALWLSCRTRLRSPMSPPTRGAIIEARPERRRQTK